MDKVKVKCGAIEKEVSKGALKWFIEAGWKVINKKSKEEDKENDKTNTKETSAT